MGQLITAVLTTMAVVAFGMANAHEVELDYVVGDPVRIRLIFLLAVTFMAGIVTNALYHMIVQLGRRHGRNRRRRRSSAMSLDLHEEDE